MSFEFLFNEWREMKEFIENRAESKKFFSKLFFPFSHLFVVMVQFFIVTQTAFGMKWFGRNNQRNDSF